MRGRFLVLAGLLTALAVLWPTPGSASSTGILERNCAFLPSTPPSIASGDSVTWTYNESGTSPCAGRNHRVQTYSAPESFDSGACDDEFSLQSTCMNGSLGRRSSFTRLFSEPGKYRYRCTFHGTLTGSRCDGMCGVITVRATATSSPSPTASPTRRPSPTPTATPTPTVTPTPTISPGATTSPTPFEPAGSGGLSTAARVLISVGVIAALGALSFVVWRVFIV